MRRLIACALGTFAAAAMTPAAHAATTIFGPDDMSLVFGPDGSISAEFGQSGIAAGDFTHIYEFIIPSSGVASGSVTTSTTLVGSLTDLDFLSVFFNGVELFGTTEAINEVVFANAVPIVAGALNRLEINGYARGNGSYGGQGTFSPSAVPEPTAWALMLVGFGAVGYSLRARRPDRRLQAV